MPNAKITPQAIDAIFEKYSTKRFEHSKGLDNCHGCQLMIAFKNSVNREKLIENLVAGSLNEEKTAIHINELVFAAISVGLDIGYEMKSSEIFSELMVGLIESEES